MYLGIAEKATDIPDFIYGAYCYAISIFNLVPTLTTTIAISALPAVTAAWTLKDKVQTKKSIESVLRITSLVAFPAGIGIAVMSKPILQLLYPDRTLGIEIAAPALSILGLAVIFVAILTPVNSMLQAVGKADIPVKLMLIGGAIKILTNFVLVANPAINVRGAPVGTLLCYIFLFFASMYFLCKRTEMFPSVKNTFLKPFAAAVCCGVAAVVSYALAQKFIDGRICTVISIIFAAIIYAICLLTFKGVLKEDIIMLPQGKKIAKILAKFHMIG
jgi:stage V sporulation protein B